MHNLDQNHTAAWNLSDERLLLIRAAKGDKEAYKRLYTHYLPKLYQHIYRFTGCSDQDTKDICQDLLVRLWDKRENLPAIHSLDAYLKRAARNALLDHLKHDRAQHHVHRLYADAKPMTARQPEDDYTFAEYYENAMKAIRSLPEKRRRIFEMRTQAGMSLDEIASVLNMSKSRIKQHIYAAKEEIKTYLRKNAGWLVLVFLFRL